MMMQLKDIAYSTRQPDHALRQFDIYYAPDSALTRPLIVFVHGGAWRSEDKRDHAGLARRLLAATGCPVAVPNYTLTPPANDDPRFWHPVHAEDIHRFLHFIHSWPSPPCNFDPASILLIGHSCSAHMLSSIFLDSSIPSLAPSAQLLSSVKAIVMSEGIYDLDALLQTFPGYRAWLVETAFGPSGSYRQFSILNYPQRPSSSIQWLLLHSKADTLVDLPQTQAMHAHLKHLDPQAVTINIDDLADDHDAILRTDAYVDIIKKFVEKFV